MALPCTLSGMPWLRQTGQAWKLRVFWTLATKAKAREFSRALVGAEPCPLCHDGVEPPRQAAPLFSAFRDM